ncbi:MAG: response regulator [Spirochaetota bacterium]
MQESENASTRVLVVDDEEPIRRLVEIILTRHGYAVESCAGGYEAVSMLGRFQPHVLLTDIVMPEGEGIELITEVAKSYPGTCAITMSGNRTGRQFLRVSEALGAVYSLSKPFSEDTLLAAVAACNHVAGVAERA